MKATLKKNSGATFEYEVAKGGASFTGTGTGGDCTSGLGSAKMTFTSGLCFASGATDNITLTGRGGER
jgi:hypothetical protein